MRGATAKTQALEPVENAPPAPVEADALQGNSEFSDLWLILNHRRWIILITTLALLLVTLAYCLLTPSVYSATAQIFIDPRDKAVVSNDVNSGTVAPDGGVTQVDSQTRVIESSAVLLRAIRAQALTKDPEFAPSSPLLSMLVGGARETETVDGTDPAELRAVRILKKKLTIKRADKVFIIDVTVSAQSARKAAQIANAITEAYLADQAEARSESANRASASLVSRLSEMRAKVSDAENKIERYKADNNLIASGGILVGEQQLTELNNQIVTARGKTADLRARIDQIDALKRSGKRGDATAEAISSTVVTQLRQREAELVQREADLRTQFGPRHPAMAAVGAQVRDVHQLVTTELDRISRAAQGDYDRARASEAALSRQLETLKSGSVTNQQASVKLRELERDLEANRSVYAAFLLRSQETREQANIDSPNARIITRATPPEDKSWPLAGFLMLGALGGGLGLGAAFSLGGEYARPSLLSRGQAQRMLGVPVFGVSVSSTDAAGTQKAMNGAALGRWLEPAPAATEPRARDKHKKLRSILLVSADDGCEGPRLARLLGRTAGTQGAKVLVVDGAVNSAQIGAGLQEVLRGEQPLVNLTEDDAETGVPSLGPGMSHADADPWGSRPQSARLLRQAAWDFDLVIIHAGPAGDNAAVISLFAGADETILVAQAGRTGLHAARDAMADVQSLGGKISAAVLLEPARG